MFDKTFLYTKSLSFLFKSLCFPFFILFLKQDLYIKYERKVENSLGKRIRAIMKESGFTSKSAFARKIGYSAQVLGKIIEGDTQNPTKKFFVCVLEAFPDINAYWLLTGKQKMFSGENDLVSSENDSIIKKLAKLLVDKVEENDRLRLELQKIKGEIINK